MPDPDFEIRERGGPIKKTFSAVWASVWSKNKRGPGPPRPLTCIRHWIDKEQFAIEMKVKV